MDDIFSLIRDGNALSVRLWLDTIENDFNQGDDHGFTLLHWTCWDGFLNIAEMLLNRGAKINAANNCEDTPLHCACQNNHLDVVLYLLKNKASLSPANLHGNTPLHYACHFNFIDIAIELVRMGALLNICNRYNQTPLDLCQRQLKEHLLNMAKSFNLNLNRIQFKEDQKWRLTRTKSRDHSLFHQIDINIDELPVEKMLESNHSGTTWKGYLQGAEVIIKVLKLKEPTQRTASVFNQEYKRLRVFNSVNILPVLGASVCLPDFILVSQYISYGSLFSVLHEQSDLNIDFAQLIKITIDIAKGMEFMHNLEQVYQYFNLNSKHVMIDDDFTSKINMADYHFSFSDKKKVYDPAWSAPEVLRKRPEEVNKKSADMWSFAVILWELFTKEAPFANFSPMQCGRLILKENLRLQIPDTMPNHIQKLIRICMNEEPSKRPAFEMILPILEKIKK